MAATNASKRAAAKNEVVSDTKELVEDVKELAEDTIEYTEKQLSWILTKPRFLVTSALLAGVVIGSAATYLVARKRLAAKYQAIADAQVADVKEHYSGTRLIPAKPNLEEVAEVAAARETVSKIVADNGYANYNKVETIPADVPQGSQLAEQAVAVEPPVETEPLEVRNVFESDHPDTYFDPAEEADRRRDSPNEPFVITADEFNANDTDYQQQSLTYYEGDDVLADQGDQPVDDSVVGAENLLRFGHGSGDPNIVYVRNNRLELDIEVVHSDGKFAKEVLGFDDGELRHSDRRPMRFRDRHDN